MTQLADTAAVGDASEPVDTTAPKNPVDDFADALGLGEDGEEPDDDELETGDDEDAEPDEESEPDEPEAPAIEPPNSLTAEEKEKFKALPREAQEFTARRIGELEKGFQAKAQEAAQTRQAVENEARAAIAQIQQQAAQELQQFAAQDMPQRPDPAMLAYDPQGFYTAQAQFESAIAQRTQAQQTAAYYTQQAQQQQMAIEQAQRQQEAVFLQSNFPEWFDPSDGAKHQQELTSIAREMGYPDDLITNARAVDILAMRRAADWKAKAEKYDALNKAKMTNVRAAKDLPKVTKPGVASTQVQNRAAKAEAAWQNVKGAKSKDAQANAFADFLENSGHI